MPCPGSTASHLGHRFSNFSPRYTTEDPSRVPQRPTLAAGFPPLEMPLRIRPRSTAPHLGHGFPTSAKDICATEGHDAITSAKDMVLTIRLNSTVSHLGHVFPTSAKDICH